MRTEIDREACADCPINLQCYSNVPISKFIRCIQCEKCFAVSNDVLDGAAVPVCEQCSFLPNKKDMVRLRKDWDALIERTKNKYRVYDEAYGDARGFEVSHMVKTGMKDFFCPECAHIEVAAMQRLISELQQELREKYLKRRKERGGLKT